MPYFLKKENELETRLDKWLYFIRYLEDFQNIPEIFEDDVFVQAFEKAEIAKYSEEERYDYERSLKTYRLLGLCLHRPLRISPLQAACEDTGPRSVGRGCQLHPYKSLKNQT
jgi:PD-(D/E)XK nuclease family transposase